MSVSAPRVATPIRTTPANATAIPATSQRGKPSPSSRPAKIAMRIGPMFTSIAVVTASRCCSAALSDRLYTANQPTPHTASRAQSRPLGRTQPRPIMSTPRTAVPTSNRPRASNPGERSSPTPRIPTKADAHARTVTTTAAIVRPSGRTAGLVERLTSPTLGGPSDGFRRIPDVLPGLAVACPFLAGRTRLRSAPQVLGVGPPAPCTTGGQGSPVPYGGAEPPRHGGGNDVRPGRPDPPPRAADAPPGQPLGPAVLDDPADRR